MVTMKSILEEVAFQYNVPEERIISKTRTADLRKLRLILWSALRSAGYSYPVIGKFTNRDHSTVNELLNRCDPLIKARGREIVETVKNRPRTPYQNYYFVTETVKVPDYKQGKIIETQRIIKKIKKY